MASRLWLGVVLVVCCLAQTGAGRGSISGRGPYVAAVPRQAHEQLAAGTDEHVQLWLNAVHSLDEFDGLARTYYRGRFYALPHVMFVIDRQDHSKVYYVNSRKFRFHKDFV